MGIRNATIDGVWTPLYKAYQTQHPLKYHDLDPVFLSSSTLLVLGLQSSFPRSRQVLSCLRSLRWRRAMDALIGPAFQLLAKYPGLTS